MTYQVGRTLAQVALEYGDSQHGDPGTRVADLAGQQLGGRALPLAVRDQELAGSKAGRARARVGSGEGTGWSGWRRRGPAVALAPVPFPGREPSHTAPDEQPLRRGSGQASEFAQGRHPGNSSCQLCHGRPEPRPAP